ncbi:auxin-induced protein X15-like [Hordeum vulgare]|nr:auxin-induced protein X15-like [Hordeum vulgare]
MPSNTSTSQGILRAPSCRNPNSSSASLSSSSNAQCPRYSVGMTNLLISSPTHTAKKPRGTSAPPPCLLPALGASASRFHFLRSCCSLTMSLILLLALPCSPIAGVCVGGSLVSGCCCCLLSLVQRLVKGMTIYRGLDEC